MKKIEIEHLGQKSKSKCVKFREEEKTLNVLSILHVYSDLVSKVKLEIGYPPYPLSEKNQKFA